jgi:hypothetical protein
LIPSRIPVIKTLGKVISKYPSIKGLAMLKPLSNGQRTWTQHRSPLNVRNSFKDELSILKDESLCQVKRPQDIKEEFKPELEDND